MKKNVLIFISGLIVVTILLAFYSFHSQSEPMRENLKELKNEEIPVIRNVSSVLEPDNIEQKKKITKSDIKNNIDTFDLPEVISDFDVSLIIEDLTAKEIYNEQDKNIRTYMPYEEAKIQIGKEVFEAFKIDQMSALEIVSAAKKLRDSFWIKGGNMNGAAYWDAYKSRFLLELAYKNSPNNLDIGDELVETICSVSPNWYSDKEGKRTANTADSDVILEIRLAQFDRIKALLNKDYMLGFKDFARCSDLAQLLSMKKDFSAASDIVQWQIALASSGEWEMFDEILSSQLEKYRENKLFKFNIYTMSDFPDEYRFCRRLPSFKGGVDPKKRGKAPLVNSEHEIEWVKK